MVEEVDYQVLRENCRRLPKWLIGGQIQRILNDPRRKPKEAAVAIQRLLDQECLVAVTINPESRVKAERGPAEAILTINKQDAYLIKVINQAGVTHRLKVAGPEIRSGREKEKGRWLSATVQTVGPKRPALSGHVVEYVILRLKGHEGRKREATLRFDVGQGTQDLGFRAEVPVLFKVSEEFNQ
jgi:hypothetical protein